MCVMWPEVWLWSADFFYLVWFIWSETTAHHRRLLLLWWLEFLSFSFFSNAPIGPTSRVPPWLPPPVLNSKTHFNSVFRLCFPSRACQQTPHKWEMSIIYLVCFAPLNFVCLCVCVRAVKWKSSPGKQHWSILWCHKGCLYLNLQPGVSSPPGDIWKACLKVCVFLNWEFLLEAVNKTKINPVNLKIVVLWDFSKGAQAHTGSEYKYLPF